MTLREMRIEDLSQVERIEKSLMSPPWTKEGFLSFLLKENTLFFVVEEKEQILGYCGMLTVLDEADITNVVVRRERQHEGIGFFMLSGAMRIARDCGITTFHLDVREGNAPARRLYERIGFVRDGLRKDYYSDPTEDAILMSAQFQTMK